MPYAKSTILGMLSLVNHVLLIDTTNKQHGREHVLTAAGMAKSKNLHRGSDVVPKTSHRHFFLYVGKMTGSKDEHRCK